jgi:extradiol dioxygenase family protein
VDAIGESVKPSQVSNRDYVELNSAPQITVEVRKNAEARRFYQEVLGCSEEPMKEGLLEFNLCCYKIACQLNPQLGERGSVVARYDLAGGKFVQIPHCSVVLESREWDALAERLKRRRANFVIKKRYDRFNGVPREQAILLLEDPSGNVLELRSFCNSAEGLLWRNRRRALRRWAPWAILTAFILCWILREAQKSEGNIGVQNYYAPARIPP